MSILFASLIFEASLRTKPQPEAEMNLKHIVLLVLLGGSVCTTLFTAELLDFSLKTMGFGWTTSYLFPRILMFVLAIAFSYFMLKAFGTGRGRVFKIITTVVVIGVWIGGYLAINPPYLDDMNKRGTEIAASKYANSSTVAIINEKHPGFEGVIFIAAPSCGFCKGTAPKMSLLQSREPGADVLTLLCTSDGADIARFEEESGVTDLEFVLPSDLNDAVQLCQGSFPSYLYFKDGNVVHQWHNEEFGYPALTWIENGLN